MGFRFNVQGQNPKKATILTPLIGNKWKLPQLPAQGCLWEGLNMMKMQHTNRAIINRLRKKVEMPKDCNRRRAG
jgi:hypothetical protein